VKILLSESQPTSRKFANGSLYLNEGQLGVWRG